MPEKPFWIVHGTLLFVWNIYVMILQPSEGHTAKQNRDMKEELYKFRQN